MITTRDTIDKCSNQRLLSDKKRKTNFHSLEKGGKKKVQKRLNGGKVLKLAKSMASASTRQVEYNTAKLVTKKEAKNC